jgi:hypothetical protein
MNENGDLQDRIGIQMGQVKMVEIKEAAEKGRNGKTEAAEKERSINHGLMGILSWDSNPMANPPRTEFPRRKNPDVHEVEKSGSEMTDMWLPAKGNWLLGSIGGITTADELEVFLLGAISILSASRVGGEFVERIRKRESKN